MMRKAAAVLTAICCLMASQVYALGLGPLTLESSLNQPLRARIEIVDLGGVSPAEIVVQMGSQQDFQRFNLERSNFFSDVDFTVESTAQGIFVLLTSNQSVREPYLSFILDTRWPSGRILSEHTVLLDLPVFSDARSIAEPINQPVSPVVETEPGVGRQQPAQASPTTASTVSEPEPAVDPEPSAEPASVTSVITEPPVVPDSLEIQETDTLWEVAMRVRPDSSVTIQQTMLAIQRLNPDAFVGGNINRLRAGETLRIPDLSQVQSISQQQAVSEVTRQNRQADLNVQPLTAPASGPSSLASSEEQGQLRVLTAEEAQSAGSGASAAIDAENAQLDARIEALENQLALQAEESDRTRLQQEELVSRLEDLDQQIASAVEIISLQDQQLAQLQESLAEAAVQASLQQQPAAEVAQPVATVSESQPIGTATPSFLDSVATVLRNNSLILIIVSVLVVLLMVMLLVRRNRMVTTEGLEVEFDNEALPQGSPEVADDRRAYNAEPDEEAVLAVAGFAGTALAGEDEDVSDAEDADETVAVTEEIEEIDVAGETDIEETAFHDFSETPEEKQDFDAESESDFETGLQEEAFSDQSADEGESELEADAVEITGINVPDETEQLNVGQADELDEIVDFELDTEVDSEQEEDQSIDVVDFDIDEFLDEDEAAVEMQSDDSQSESAADSSDSEQGLDFELDTDLDDDVTDGDSDEGSEESTGIDFEEVEFTAESDSGEVEEIEVEQEGEVEAELEIDTFALEDEETAEQADEEITVGDEIESLDFDLSSDGIGDGGDADGADLESVSDSEVETFDFELGAVDAEDEAAEEQQEEPQEEQTAEHEQATEDLGSVDFALNTEAEPEQSPQPEAAADLEVTGLEEVEFTPAEPEVIAATEADVDEAEPEVEIEAVDKIEASEEAKDTEQEMLDVGAQETTDAAADADQELVFEADESSNNELENELEVEAERKDSSAEADLEQEKSDSAASEAEDAENPETIELVAKSDENTDETGEALTQDGEAGNPEAEVELSNLDFLTTENDSVNGADQDSDLLSDDDEAATKLDLAYAYQKMGDVNGAKEILEEVLKEGNDAQVSEAKNLIEALQS
ncbi:MAG: hypothetical protein KJN90_11975 [Gammaproteobacteria bacterium]|nr:hypothetical protein [Gammaproteobacteria bacterium]